MTAPSYHPNPFTRYFLRRVIERLPTAQAIKAQYRGLSLLPWENVYEWKITWESYKARNNLAGLYAVDGQPIPGHDMGFQSHFAEVATIMATQTLRQDDVMVLREAGESAIKTSATNAANARAMKKLSKKLQWCRDVMDATIEYLIMWTLQGQVRWPPRNEAGGVIANPPPYWGDVSFSFTTGLTAAFQQAATTLAGWDSGSGAESGAGVSWQNIASDPIGDLEIINRHMRSVLGMPIRGALLVMDDRILSYLVKNTGILGFIKPTDTSAQMLSTQDIETHIKNRLGYDIMTYSAMWTYEYNVDDDTVDRELIPFMTPGRILIIPPWARGDLGYTADAVHEHSDGRYNPGLDIWSYKEPRPPYKTEVGTKRMAMPILEQPEVIYRFDAWD